MHTAVVLWVTMLIYMSTFGWWTILQVSTKLGSLGVAYLQAGMQKESITQSSEGPLFKAKANSTCANVLTPQRVFVDTITQQAHYIEEVCSHLVGITCSIYITDYYNFLKGTYI